MSSHLQIRKLERSEKDIWLSIILDNLRWLEERGIRQWTEEYTRQQFRITQERDENYLVVECGDSKQEEIVAVLTLSKSAPSHWKEETKDTNSLTLSKLAVRLDKRGNKIGRRAVQLAKEVTKNSGASSLILEIAYGNGFLYNYYESLGFKEKARRDIEYSSGIYDIVLMELCFDTNILQFKSEEEPTLLDEILELRYKVWRETGLICTFRSEEERWGDDADESATHFAALKTTDGTPTLIGAARCHIYSSLEEIPQAEWLSTLSTKPRFPIGFYSRLVVATSHQKQGVSRLLDNARDKFVRDNGGVSLLTDVPEYRISPMERDGWSVIQEPSFGVIFPDTKWAAMYKELS